MNINTTTEKSKKQTEEIIKMLKHKLEKSFCLQKQSLPKGYMQYSNKVEKDL